MKLTKRDDDRFGLDRFFDDRFLEPFNWFPSMWGRRFSFPKVDVIETDREVEVVADIPGVDPAQVDIEVSDEMITIAGRLDKKEEKRDEEGKVYRYEREYGEFRRELPLPAKVLADQARAECKNGVLSITIPKVDIPPAKKVKIDVK